MSHDERGYRNIKLNKELQQALNPSTQEITRGDRIFKLNDKVMQIRNNSSAKMY